MAAVPGGRIVVQDVDDVWDYLCHYAVCAPPFWHQLAKPIEEERHKYPEVNRAEDVADGIAPLGGDESKLVGWVKRPGQVRIARFLDTSQLNKSGLIRKDKPSWSHDPLAPHGNDLRSYSAAHQTFLQYTVTPNHARGCVQLAANVHSYLYMTGIGDKVSVKGAFKLGYPIPTFKAAVQAASLNNPNRIMAAKVPFHLIEFEEDDDGNLLPGDQDNWHLLHSFKVLEGSRFKVADDWTGSDDAIRELISDGNFAAGVRRMDEVAWAIASESTYWFWGGGDTARFLKGGLMLAAGAALAIFGAAELLDGDSGADAVGALGGVDPSEGFTAASDAGTQYAHDVQFGSSVSVYDPSGVDKVTDVSFPGSSSTGTDAHGNHYSMDQMGRVRKT